MNSLAVVLLTILAAGPRPARKAPARPRPPAAEPAAPAPSETSEPGETTATAQAAPAAAPHGPAVKLTAELAGYGDTDAVYVASPTVAFTVSDDLAGWSVGGRYLVDAVSAASVDIVSTASSKWTELRHVGAADVAIKGGGVGLSVSGSVSREPDYLSIGGGGIVSFELLDKNFVPFVGGSYTHDDVGRTGLDHRFWNTQVQVGVQGGATIVVDRATIASVSMDAIFDRGYLAKPYRYVPLFAPDTAGSASLGPGASVAQVNRLRIDERPVDAVPGARDRFALSGRIAHRFDGSTIRFDERAYRDSWGLLASTSDLRYVVDLGSRFEVWPHVRVHAQKGVDFWQRAFQAVPGPDGHLGPPQFRSGDRELGPLGTLTVGLGIRWRLSGEGAPPWILFVQGEGMVTRYWDALYITERRAVFTTVGLEVGVN
jgi:hypothetical protein